MPFISSLHSCASRVSDQRVFPALLVGMMKRGIISTPSVASIQFFWYIASRATMRVMVLDRMLASVPLTTCCTPEMSLVMRVMMSPCL